LNAFAEDEHKVVPIVKDSKVGTEIVAMDPKEETDKIEGHRA